MSIIMTRAQRRELERENASRPLYLEAIPRSEWPNNLASRVGSPIQVWRSRHFLVQQYAAPEPAMCRLSVGRTSLNGDRWVDGITWDDLQWIKAQCGYADSWAVEIYPPDEHVINVANIRHLWLIQHAPEFAWPKENH